MTRKRMLLTLGAAATLYFTTGESAGPSTVIPSSTTPRPFIFVGKPELTSAPNLGLDTLTWNEANYLTYKDFVTDTVAGGYALMKKDTLTESPGYGESIVGFNRIHVLRKSGKAITQDIARIGVREYAALLGVTVGTGDSVEDLFDNLQDRKDLYRDKAKQYGVDRRTLLAIGAVESHLEPFAVSPASCLGAQQLHSSVYKDRNPFDSVENVDMSAGLLRFLLEHYQGNDTLALTAYNRGYGGLDDVIKKATAAGVTKTQDIIDFRAGGDYLLPLQSREYADKVYLYKELIRQYLPGEGKDRFIERYQALREGYKQAKQAKLLASTSTPQPF